MSNPSDHDPPDHSAPDHASQDHDPSGHTSAAHAQLEELPQWPARTIAFLVTVDELPHAIPVSAPVRADAKRVLLSLKRTRNSLARLRRRPQVALTLLAAEDVAFTANGTAQVLEEPMAVAPDYAAVEILVASVEDHRQAEFAVEAGPDRRWREDSEKQALGRRVKALAALASSGGAQAPESER
jgi:hypothetical protein